jgi:kumamolisin
MKNQHLTTGLLLSLFACSLGFAHAQQTDEVAVTGSPKPVTEPTLPKAIRMAGGTILTPPSSTPPAKQGTTKKSILMQTDLEIYVPAGWKPAEVSPPNPTYTPAPPFAGYAYETPASLACIYALVTVTTGCNPNSVTAAPTGGSKAIAIVDAYDDPFAGPDLAYFSSQFGISFDPAQLQVVYENGTVPAVDPTGGWETEESLDMEYAHAMAPSATIYLVEAQSATLFDLLTSVEIAGNLVRCGRTEQNLSTLAVGTCPTASTGMGEVTMSWGGAEFSGEMADDSVFTRPGVVYLASSGDTPGTYWPCTSPNVICAGGTTIRRNAATGGFIEEASWDAGGGGASLYEKRPAYQSSVSSIVGTARGVPDVALDSNPITGLWVWNSFGFALDIYEEPANNAGWEILGGTSAASPTWAGILNRAGSFAAGSSAELTRMYTDKAVATAYRDITAGFCGPYDGYGAATGWDPCAGIGSVQGYTDK